MAYTLYSVTIAIGVKKFFINLGALYIERTLKGVRNNKVFLFHVVRRKKRNLFHLIRHLAFYLLWPIVIISFTLHGMLSSILLEQKEKKKQTGLMAKHNKYKLH